MSEIVDIKIKPTREMFYSNETNYGIYACETNDKVELNKYGNISIKGNTTKLQMESEYNARLEKKSDKKYGTYYEIVSIFQDIPKDIASQRTYLQTILTERQVDAIYKAYPDQDIIQLIKSDQFDYKKVHGVGKSKYEVLKEKVIENLEFQQAYEFLSGYGVTNNLIIKLVKHFKSSSLLIAEMKKNPYSITSVSGVGFKKADVIAMEMGYDSQGEFRIVSAIEYVVEEESNSGHTYCKVSKAIEAVEDMINVKYSVIGQHIKSTDKIVLLDGDILALKKNYQAEKFIAKSLKSILEKSNELNFDVASFIEQQEKEHGLTLTDQQKQLFYNLKQNNVNVLTGYAGCVDQYTEYFNGYEWKKISEYSEGEKVLQYNEDGTATPVEPLAYHKLPETKMTLVKTDLGSINQCLSNEHTVVYRTSKGHIAKLPFYEVKKRHREVKQGFYGKFITFFNYDGVGIDLTDEQLRVMVMVIGDGHFPSMTSRCVVRIKKERKHERIRMLLANANIPYVEKESVDDYLVFTFVAPLRLKEFDSSWYQCSNHQLQVICDEVLHWDGSVDKKGRQRFAANVKSSAEFIQFAFSATGHRATLTERDRTGEIYSNKHGEYIRKSKEYNVQIAKNKWVSLFAKSEDKKTPLIEVTPEDGHKYCFTVPSGMWVMRREGRICVTGNCGKSQMVALLINLLNKLNISYRLLSPTGKAAKVLSNYTGKEAETIHRAIGMGRKNDEDEILIHEEFIIVDESSMLDVRLCATLLSKLKHPNVRVLFIGDDFQIPSVSAGNVLSDLIHSDVVPVTKLDQVFRQKEGSILDVATKIRKQERFLDNSFWGIKQLDDKCTIACVPKDKMEGGYKYFVKELLKEYKVEDIMTLTPTKKAGLGTVEVNKEIQEIVNPEHNAKLEKEYGFDKVKFREGDLVMNIRNTYNMEDVEGKDVSIVNGDVGLIEVVDIVGEEVIVDFGFAKIPFPYSKLGQLLHGWCITKHKSQGSGSPAVLIIMDRAHKYQLNNNLLYTAVTRCKEHLVILTQAETVNFAMKKLANMERNTLLKGMLQIGE